MNLQYLVTIPVIILISILAIFNNYNLNYIPKETINLNSVTLLQEDHLKIPYVLQKYYSHVINITANIFPSLLSSSFWHNNIENLKEKIAKKAKDDTDLLVKKLGLLSSIFLLIVILILWLNFEVIFLHYQFLIDLLLQWKWMKEMESLNLYFGLDSLSLPFIVLVGFIFPLVYLSNWTTIHEFETYYIIIILLLEFFLIIVFIVIDFIMFYIFFESILPLLFLLIGLYGASQKFRAGYYIFLYTLLGSLFMLLSFVKGGSDTGTPYFEENSNNKPHLSLQKYICFILFGSFSVKTPLIPVHIWLPLAHADANVSGSIVLASIVLKLALYGFIRILISIYMFGVRLLNPIFLAFCSLSVIYASNTTIRQFDLKMIVAYSSIAHMASTLLGTFSDTLYGLIGSILFGIGHGLVSPALFYLVGASLYDRCGSRFINYFRGLSNIIPLFAILLLFFSFSNMGMPLTGNFIGEFLSLLGAYQQNVFVASIGAISIILSAVYSIFMYNRVSSGALSPHILTIPDTFRKEFFVISPLLILTILIGLYPYFITADIEFGLSHCLLFSFSPVLFTNPRPHHNPSDRNLNDNPSDRNLNNNPSDRNLNNNSNVNNNNLNNNPNVNNNNNNNPNINNNSNVNNNNNNNNNNNPYNNNPNVNNPNNPNYQKYHADQVMIQPNRNPNTPDMQLGRAVHEQTTEILDRLSDVSRSGILNRHLKRTLDKVDSALVVSRDRTLEFLNASRTPSPDQIFIDPNLTGAMHDLTAYIESCRNRTLNNGQHPNGRNRGNNNGNQGNNQNTGNNNLNQGNNHNGNNNNYYVADLNKNAIKNNNIEYYSMQYNEISDGPLIFNRNSIFEILQKISNYIDYYNNNNEKIFISIWFLVVIILSLIWLAWKIKYWYYLFLGLR